VKVKNLREWDVVVPLGDGSELAVEAGGTVEVDDDLGKRLCEQGDNWKRADAKPAASTSTSKAAKAAKGA
jgi:hypothetical protein